MSHSDPQIRFWRGSAGRASKIVPFVAGARQTQFFSGRRYCKIGDMRYDDFSSFFVKAEAPAQKVELCAI